MIKIAIPTESNLGLKDTLSQHFGRSPYFTIVSWDPDTKSVEVVEILTNQGHEEAACLNPVIMLQNTGINSIIVSRIGMRPLQGFRERGITAFRALEGSVEFNLKAFSAKKLEELTMGTCQHHGGIK
jgi:predicted Fe-Mo cluster-binding NifX family protein